MDLDLISTLWPGLAALAGVAVSATTALVLWWGWPVLAGAARAKDPLAERARKWNRHIAPLLRKRLAPRIEVADMVVEASRLDGAAHTLATWRMLPCLVPDVRWIALADPTAPPPGGVRAVAEAVELRALLGDAVHAQRLWGHAAFLYVWPDSVDLDAAAARLVPVDEMTARHGLELGAVVKGTPP